MLLCSSNFYFLVKLKYFDVQQCIKIPYCQDGRNVLFYVDKMEFKGCTGMRAVSYYIVAELLEMLKVLHFSFRFVSNIK